MESKNVRDQHLEAGERTVSPALRCLRRAKVAQGPADWLGGFSARDRLTWTAGFIEGAAQRLQRLASMRIMPRFALPLWWRP
jgi:hypothetical protein